MKQDCGLEVGNTLCWFSVTICLKGDFAGTGGASAGDGSDIGAVVAGFGSTGDAPDSRKSSLGGRVETGLFGGAGAALGLSANGVGEKLVVCSELTASEAVLIELLAAPGGGLLEDRNIGPVMRSLPSLPNSDGLLLVLEDLESLESDRCNEIELGVGLAGLVSCGDPLFVGFFACRRA